jgi:carboxymethylenebutenolidase
MGEMIRFHNGGNDYEGYLAVAEGGQGPGVVVIQEWWGLVDHIKSVCDRFSAAGFTALAPDFYRGEKTSDPDEAGRLMMALDIDQSERILAKAIVTLLAGEATTGDKVGVVGFCMGGQLALYAATVNPQIGAAVDFYGIHPNVRPKLEGLAAPLLGFFAENDPYATPEAVASLKADLEALGKEHELVSYPGRDHAFFNDDRPEVFDEDAAADSWDRMVRFFRDRLG